MSGIGTGYDLSVSTFSPDGRVFQTDYAQKAVDNSGTVIGIKCIDGVVLGIEKTFVSKMLVAGSNRRTYAVAQHAGVAIAGVSADGRQIVNRAVAEAEQYKKVYGERIPGQVLSERIGSYVHLFSMYWYVRPYGTSTLLASYDDDGPQLHLIEPSGTSLRFFGTAVGKGRQGAKTDIERLDLKAITCRQAVKEITKMDLLVSSALREASTLMDDLPRRPHASRCSLHTVHDEEKPIEVELAWICDESERKFQRVPADLAAEAEKAAKEALNSDMED